MALLSELSTLSSFPQRIVSLIPSVTCSLFDLGFGEQVVGVTDYCLPPPGTETRLTRVGGPKTLQMAVIQALAPDLVIANQEENDPASVQSLAQDFPVWLTFPLSVRQALIDLWQIVNLAHVELAFYRMRSLEYTLELSERVEWDANESLRVFAPIWMDTTQGTPWWMTFNAATYPGDVLRLCGMRNIFAQRDRRYPLQADLGLQPAELAADRDTRYPRVTADEIAMLNPEVILLPSEPYGFGKADIETIQTHLAGCDAVRNGRIIPVDGRLLTWHGTYSARALMELPELVRK